MANNNMQNLAFNVPGMTGAFTVVDAEARAQLKNKLDATALPEAVNTALVQAKESGEFDGAPGDPGYTPVKGKDYFDGENGEDGVSPTVAVSSITGGHRIAITDKSGTKTVDVLDGEKGDAGRGITSVARTSGNGAAGTTDTYTITYTDGSKSTFTVNNGKDGSAGINGQRGTGVLKVTTAPASYTTTTGGKNPIKRMAISTIKSQAYVDEVLVGDQIAYSYYHYHVYYLDATYAYMDTYQSIRGASGTAGDDGKDGATYTPSLDASGNLSWTNNGGLSNPETVNIKGPKGSDAAVTAANIQTALGYVPADTANVVQRQQGSANVGKVLMVGSDGNLILTDMPVAGGDITGVVDDSNNIILSGDLADGTYTLKYIKADGTYVDAGELVVSSIATYAIICNLTNCTSSGADTIRQGGTTTITIMTNEGYNLPDSITVSGAEYTWDKSSGQIALSNPTSDVTITVAAVAVPTYTNLADQTSADWKKNARINSSGSQVSATGVDITNYIPVQDTSIIHIKGLDILSSLPSGSNYGRVYYYDSNKTWVTYGQPSTTGGDFYNAADYDDTVTVYNWAAAKQYFGALKDAEVSYVRFGGIPTADDIIITVDEPIA